MGCSKYGYKYLKWGYKKASSIVTLILTLITKSHDPLSKLRCLQGWGGV